MSDEYLNPDIKRYTELLKNVAKVYQDDPVLDRIATSIIRSAAEKCYGAGMSGSMGDGGAMAMIDKFASFLEGVRYGSFGSHQDDLGSYTALFRKLTVKEDPKYQEYLRLKQQFGDIDD